MKCDIIEAINYYAIDFWARTTYFRLVFFIVIYLHTKFVSSYIDIENTSLIKLAYPFFSENPHLKIYYATNFAQNM